MAPLPFFWPLRRQSPDERPLPAEQERPGTLTLATREQLTCPNCEQRAPVTALACPHCGFPFSCDITPPLPRSQARMETWRVVLAILALLTLFSSGGLYRDSVSEYEGLTYKLSATLQPEVASGIPLAGPPAFVTRTGLALRLIEERAPQFYWRLQASVQRIEYLSPERLNSPQGRSISMEGIGAVSTPSLRLVQVLPTTAFPSEEEANDRTLFNYAATLVHELRHIELHWNGQAPGGWQEEVLCEQSALSFLQQAQAPPALIVDKQVYLADPLNRRYQGWYDWYKQFK